MAQTYPFASWTVPAADISVYDSEGVQRIRFGGGDVVASPAALMEWTEMNEAVVELDVPTHLDPHGSIDAALSEIECEKLCRLVIKTL
jgi:hypothetical protein